MPPRKRWAPERAVEASTVNAIVAVAGIDDQTLGVGGDGIDGQQTIGADRGSAPLIKAVIESFELVPLTVSVSAAAHGIEVESADRAGNVREIENGVDARIGERAGVVPVGV